MTWEPKNKLDDEDVEVSDDDDKDGSGRGDGGSDHDKHGKKTRTFKKISDAHKK